MSGTRAAAGRVGAQGAAAARALACGGRAVPRAARQAGAVLALSAIGATLAFTADHAALGATTQVVRAAGWLLMALMLPAKLGALYRLAAGATAELEPGGLQWRRLDARLAVTAASLLSLAAFAAAGLGVALAFARAALAPPAAQVATGMALVVLPGALALFARMALVMPAEASLPQPRFAEGFLASRGRSLAASLVLAAAGLAPTAAWLALAFALERWEVSRGWPVAEALLAGAAIGATTNFLAAPLLAGALTGLYREATGAAPLAPGPVAGEAEALGHTAPQEPLAP